jgi:hypothetical protein
MSRALIKLFPRKPAPSGTACCDWRTFVDGFAHHWGRRQPGAPLPTSEEVRQAVIDWQSGNSGYESVRMARAAQGDKT